MNEIKNRLNQITQDEYKIKEIINRELSRLNEKQYNNNNRIIDVKKWFQKINTILGRKNEAGIILVHNDIKIKDEKNKPIQGIIEKKEVLGNWINQSFSDKGVE